MTKYEYLEVIEPKIVKPLTTKLNIIPTHKEYKQAVEDELWKVIVGENSVDLSSVQVEDLSPEKQSLIAVQDNNKPPWWMRCFSWEFFSERQGTWKVPENEVSGLSGYDIETTTLYKPEYITTRSGSVYSVLNALDHFREEFERYLESADMSIDEESAPSNEMSIPELPLNNTFQFVTHDQSGPAYSKIVTSGEFNEWFTALSSLCPPVEPTMTGLVYAQAGVDMKVIEGKSGSDWVLDPGAVSRLKNIGLYDESTAGNVKYGRWLRQLLKYDSEFDRRLEINSIPSTRDTSQLSGLERLLYRDWASQTEAATNAEQLIKYAVESQVSKSAWEELNNSEYAEIFVSSPIDGGKWSRKRPTFSSLLRDTYGSYNGEQALVDEILDVLRDSGLYVE